MTSNLPPITIGIPFYNAEATLLDAVRSVFVQTHQNWELILLDDGSTDRSLELARSIKDPRVKVYSDGQNKRLAARLNQIPGLATHDYLARMDADDLISPVRIERQLSLLVRRPELDLVSTGICSLTDKNEPLGVRCTAENFRLVPRNVLAGRAGIVHASLVGSKAWFIRNQYRENLKSSEDANLWIRAYSKGDLAVGFVNAPLYYYREDGNVVLSKLATAYREGIRTILKDSGEGYSSMDKIYAYSLTATKLIVANAFAAIGSLELLRKRRNGQILSSIEEENLREEIEYIRNFKLPQ